MTMFIFLATMSSTSRFHALSLNFTLSLQSRPWARGPLMSGGRDSPHMLSPQCNSTERISSGVFANAGAAAHAAAPAKNDLLVNFIVILRSFLPQRTQRSQRQSFALFAAKSDYHSATEPSACRQTGFFQLWGVLFSSITRSLFTSTPSPGRRGSSTQPSVNAKSSLFVT